VQSLLRAANCFASRATQIRMHQPATNQPDGQITKTLSIPARKNISLNPSGKSVIQIRPVSPDQRGVAHVTTRCGGMRWTRASARDERLMPRTAKSCGPGAPTLASSWRRCWRIAPMTVANKPGHRGEHEVSRKPPRRESRRYPVHLWSYPRAFLLHGAYGCDRHPAFPAPSVFLEGANAMQGSGTSCREDAGLRPQRCLTCETDVAARHCERSEAIHVATCWDMDCFVAFAPRNDIGEHMARMNGVCSLLEERWRKRCLRLIFIPHIASAVALRATADKTLLRATRHATHLARQ
jgi:hypothetical protein